MVNTANLFLAGFAVCAMLSTIVAVKLARQVNAHLPEPQRFSYWRWTYTEHTNLSKSHKRLFPESNWRRYYVLSYVGMGVFVGLALCLAWLHR